MAWQPPNRDPRQQFRTDYYEDPALEGPVPRPAGLGALLRSLPWRQGLAGVVAVAVFALAVILLYLAGVRR